MRSLLASALLASIVLATSLTHAAPPVVEKSVTGWIRTLDAPYAGLGSAVITKEGEFVIRSGKYITAYNSETGEYLWKFEVGELPLEFGPILSYKGDLFLLGTAFSSFFQKNAVFCLNARSHKLIWEKEMESLYHEAASAEGLFVYQGKIRGDRVMYARTRKAGQRAYKIDLKRYYRNMVYADSYILADTGREKLYALEVDNLAKPKWSYKVTETLRAPAVYENNCAYVIDGAGVIHAIDTQTGKSQWTYALGGNGSVAPILYGDRLYVISSSGTMVALHAVTGKAMWKIYTEGKPYAAPGCASGGLIVPLDNGRVLAVNRDNGEVYWELQSDYEFTIDCAADKDFVYLIGNRSGKSRIYAVDSRRIQHGYEVIEHGNDAIVQPPRQDPPPQNNNNLPLDEVRIRLRHLKELYEEGLIPDDVYSTKVREILDKYID